MWFLVCRRLASRDATSAAPAAVTRRRVALWRVAARRLVRPLPSRDNDRVMHPTHRRDYGLRRVASTTRRVAVASIALTAAFTALMVRAQPGRSARARATTPAVPGPAVARTD